MAITCHIFECNALHYNYVMRKKCPLQITFHYFENVIHYNYITITITITPGLVTIGQGEIDANMVNGQICSVPNPLGGSSNLLYDLI